MSSGHSDNAPLDLNAITMLEEEEAKENVDPKVAKVYGIMKAWGKGKFNGDDCALNAKEAGYSPDVKLDGRGVSEKVWGKQYSGIDGVCEFFAQIASLPFKMSDFKLQASPYVNGNQVIFGITYDIENKETKARG